MNLFLLPKDNLQASHTRNAHTRNAQNAHITDASQIQHIRSVLKAKVGDSIKVGVMNGQIGTAIIEHIDSQQICLTDLTLTQSPPDKLPLTVILALPRPKVLRRLIMDMTALGVARIILINSYRTEKSYWQSPLLNRLDEFVIEGLQQSLDSVPPIIELKKRFKPFVEDELSKVIEASRLASIDNSSTADSTIDTTTHNTTHSTTPAVTPVAIPANIQARPATHAIHAIVAHPYAEMSLQAFMHSRREIKNAGNTAFDDPINQPLNSLQPDLSDTSHKHKHRHSLMPFVLCIGAEGGWIDYEIELLQAHGCLPVSLGQRILRTESAVNVLIGQWL